MANTKAALEKAVKAVNEALKPINGKEVTVNAPADSRKPDNTIKQ